MRQPASSTGRNFGTERPGALHAYFQTAPCHIMVTDDGPQKIGCPCPHCLSVPLPQHLVRGINLDMCLAPTVTTCGLETSVSTSTSLLTSDQRDLKSTAMATPSEVGITCQRALSMDNQEALSDLEWAVGVEVWPIYGQPVSCTTSVQSPCRLESCLAAHRAQAVRAWCDHEACMVHLKCSLALVRFSAATLTSRLKTACGIHAKHVAALAAGCWSVSAAGAR